MPFDLAVEGKNTLLNGQNVSNTITLVKTLHKLWFELGNWKSGNIYDFAI